MYRVKNNGLFLSVYNTFLPEDSILKGFRTRRSAADCIKENHLLGSEIVLVKILLNFTTKEQLKEYGFKNGSDKNKLSFSKFDDKDNLLFTIYADYKPQNDKLSDFDFKAVVAIGEKRIEIMPYVGIETMQDFIALVEKISRIQ